MLTCLLNRAVGGAVTKVAGYMGSRSVSEGGAPGVREPTLETETLALKNIDREVERIKLGLVTKVQELWTTPW